MLPSGWFSISENHQFADRIQRRIVIQNSNRRYYVVGKQQFRNITAYQREWPTAPHRFHLAEGEQLSIPNSSGRGTAGATEGHRRTRMGGGKNLPASLGAIRDLFSPNKRNNNKSPSGMWLVSMTRTTRIKCCSVAEVFLRQMRALLRRIVPGSQESPMWSQT